MKEILERLYAQEILSREEAREVLVEIASAKHPPAQVSSFLTVYRMRELSSIELEGFRDAMLELCVSADLSAYDAIDVCGTGGDGKNTFNISTLSAFVIAGAGVNVSKHGNYGVSSVCGSSNVLENIGVEFAKDEMGLKQQIEKAGICFMHAPFFHPAMKNVGPIRKEMGVKTFFNLLGPIVNPSRPKKQVVGVYDLDIAALYSKVLSNSHESFAILHALDGYDEISLTGPFRMITKQGEETLEPADLGLNPVAAEEIFGGDSVEEAGGIFMNILSGKGSAAQNNVVIANAAVGIHVASGQSLSDCVGSAKESLESGKALEVLSKLKG